MVYAIVESGGQQYRAERATFSVETALRSRDQVEQT